MNVLVNPAQNISGIITIPPSKSLAHRLIIAASLAKGKSKITNIDYSMDIKATIKALVMLGAKIEEFDDYVIVAGIEEFNIIDQPIDCGESGSTLRFIIPLMALTNQRISLKGHGKLLDRPQTIYQKIFDEQALMFKHEAHSIELQGAISSADFHLDGNVSSQFISGLLFVLPLAEGDSKLIIKEPFESRSYVNLTIDILAKFNIKIEMHDNVILVKGGQTYRKFDMAVAGDYSQLAFWAGLGSINREVQVLGLDHNSKQGDKAIVAFIRKFKGDVTMLDNGYLFKPSQLKGAVIDLADCPDLGPMVMVLASLAEGKTMIINAGRLRIKESDRIAAMEVELKKIGVNITSTFDEVTIIGHKNYEGGVTFNGHNDHRIVMALSIISTITEKSNKIIGGEAINKSYPNFFNDLRSLGIEVEQYED